MSVSVGNHRLVLLRHGETEWSRDRKHTSRTDLDLTDRGREQARLAAQTLEHLGLDNPLVVSSPRRRWVVRTVTSEMKQAGSRWPAPVLIVWVVVAKVATGVCSPRPKPAASA